MLTMCFDGIHVGDTIHNDNGDDYLVCAVNPDKDRTLLAKLNSNGPYYVGAWALQKCRNNNGNWYWGQGHYYRDDLTAASIYVMGEN